MERLMGAMAQVVKAIVKWIKRVVIVINSMGFPLFIALLVGTVITISIAEQSNSSSGDKETSISEEDAGEGTAQDTIKFAKQYVGKNLQYFLDHDNSGRFFGNHWCAMFCGYVLYNTNKDTYEGYMKGVRIVCAIVVAAIKNVVFRSIKSVLKKNIKI